MSSLFSQLVMPRITKVRPYARLLARKSRAPGPDASFLGTTVFVNVLGLVGATVLEITIRPGRKYCRDEFCVLFCILTIKCGQ